MAATFWLSTQATIVVYYGACKRLRRTFLNLLQSDQGREFSAPAAGHRDCAISITESLITFT
jgi:hypothetical protein